MNPLSGIADMAVDRMLGLRSAGVRYVLRRDVAVEMPDGVVLLGDLYRPAGDDRPLPVVLIRSPYGRAGLSGMVFAAPLARRGFQVFIQSNRGTFGSGLAQHRGRHPAAEPADRARRRRPSRRRPGPGGRGGALPDRVPDPGRAPDPRAGQRGRVPALRPQLRHRAALRHRHQCGAMPVRDPP